MTLRTGWATVPLEAVAEVRLGRQRSPKNHAGDDMRPYLRAANVGWRGLRLDDVKEMNFTDKEAKTFSLRDGDIVMSEASGSASEVGKPALWSGEIEDCCFQNTLIRVRSHGIDPRFLLHFLRYEARRGAFVAHARGVGIHHLGSARLAKWPVPVPPPEDQSYIADAMDEVELTANAVEDRLSAIVAQYDRAFDLVVYESLIGPPSDDFDRQASSHDANLLPDGWEWQSLDAIADIGSGVTKDTKRQSDTTLPAIPYLRVANVQRNRLDLRDIAEIRVTPERAQQYLLQAGDVLMTEGGDRDKLGRGWIWEDQIPNCIHQNHIFRVRLRSGSLAPKLLSWYGNTYGRMWFERNGKQSTNLASLSMSVLKRLPIPVPPAATQPSIVEAIQTRIGLLDRIRERVVTERQSVGELRLLAGARFLHEAANVQATPVAELAIA
ncbi:restriction endonuclease subunit S [Polymorphospora rubra]|uniref:restriction endonuclease subunit S n=1 Tax=Polymorphospora rubra TaxID=338584 RepID=UPI0033DB1391